MSTDPQPGQAADKRLFTPGPLTTSASVKHAMLRDLGSRDRAFIQTVRRIRSALLAIGGVQEPDFAAIPMQGSGTFSIEAVLGSVTPANGHWLVAINGAYGRRIVQIARVLGLAVTGVEVAEDRPVTPQLVADALAAEPAITHVATVHCETTSGILNPVAEIGRLVADSGRAFFVDAMSSFGAIPLNLESAGIDYLVSSANKCIEGVPGFGFVLARRARLEATAGLARSLALDLLAQVQGLDRDGQFRFTPPTHALLAFEQALRELEREGGPQARGQRYEANRQVLMAGMRGLGFQPYLADSRQSCIIQSFHYPDWPGFDFNRFYQALSERGFLIYPGKVSHADCFRIGTIGRLFVEDFQQLIVAIGEVSAELRGS